MSLKSPITNLPEPLDDRAIWNTWLGIFHYPSLMAADHIGLFPFLEKQPSTVDEVCRGLNMGLRSAEALLKLMACLGFLEFRESRYCLTPVATQYLLPESPYYWGGFFSYHRDKSPLYTEAIEAIESDRTQGTRTDRSLVAEWKSGALDKERARRFTAAMHSHTFALVSALAKTKPLPGNQKFLDVAGGSGCAAIAFALANPGLKATVLELPTVCEIVREDYLPSFGLSDRIDTLALNMFLEDWPKGYSIAFLSNILHDWEMAQCRILLKQAFNALPPGGQVWIHELLSADNQPGPLSAASFSFTMLLRTQGKQYSFHELGSLLTEVGFKQLEMEKGLGHYSLVTGVKP